MNFKTKSKSLRPNIGPFQDGTSWGAFSEAVLIKIFSTLVTNAVMHTKKLFFLERKWRFNGKKEKTWRGSKSAFLPLSLHFLILSLSCLLFISSQFSHSIAIFSEAASQLPSTCASHSGMLFFNEIFQNRSIFQKFLNRRKKVLKNTVFWNPSLIRKY